MAARFTNTTFTVKLLDVHRLGFVEHHPSWDVSVIVDVTSPYGQFQLDVRIEKVMSLDQAVVQAIEQVERWGSRFGEFGRAAISERVR